MFIKNHHTKCHMFNYNGSKNCLAAVLSPFFKMFQTSESYTCQQCIHLTCITLYSIPWKSL